MKLLATMLLLTLAGTGWGAVLTAGSCHQDSVQAKIDLATDGDTVVMPAGTATWTGYPAVTIAKELTLRGSGVNSTFVKDSIPYMGLLVTTAAGRTVRITGISFLYKGIISSQDHVVIIVDGVSPGVNDYVRIDNCNFVVNAAGLDQGKAAIQFRVDCRGLIDHCYFKNSNVDIIGSNYGSTAWRAPLQMGTDQAIYMENNVWFSDLFSNATDANWGGRYVARYNTVYNSYFEAHSCQGGYLHEGDSLPYRGTRLVEIYNNTFYAVDSGYQGIASAMSIRSGTGVIYNNSVENISGESYTRLGRVDNVRSAESRQYVGACDGTMKFDGNASDSGWPCLDQIGRSTDPETGYHPQDSVPMYNWGNTLDGNADTIYLVTSGRNLQHIRVGRDLIHGEAPGYAAYEYPHPLIQNQIKKKECKTTIVR